MSEIIRKVKKIQMSYFLKKGDRPEKRKKKNPLITDGRVKAFIRKALTGRLNDESFTYYYSMFRSTLISPSLHLRYITRHSWSFIIVCFPLSF